MSGFRCLNTAFVVLAVTGILGAPLRAPLHAQGTTADASIAAVDSTPVSLSALAEMPLVVPAAALGPSIPVAAPVALRRLTHGETPVAPMMREQTSRSVAMMIVGGAALIVGSVVDGDSGTIIMVGGGVIGLIGLWNYLK